MKNALHRAATMFVVTAFSFGTAAHAEDTKLRPLPEADSAHESGMRVYLDPETGMLSPVPVTPEQVVEDEMFKAAHMPAPMEELRRADGTVTVRLNGNFEVASQVVIAPDGRRISMCTDAAHAGQAPHTHFLAAPMTEER